MISTGDEVGVEPVAVISNTYWKRAFSGVEDVLGRGLGLGSTNYTIVGVAPPGFTGDWVGRPVDVWIPLAYSPGSCRNARTY
jgi:hypothetical protein